MNYKIGLDIGIASVGWCVLELDQNEEPFRIMKMGTRVFDLAEHPKDGSSLALPRREARGTRRRLRRHKHRMERIRRLLLSANIVEQEELEQLYSGQLSDIYQLRTDALDRVLSGTEFARVLVHLAQRRGFQSNRKAGAGKDEQKEEGRLLEAVKNNTEIMKQNKYRTVGEMFCKDPQFAVTKRNKGGDYAHTISRMMVLEESREIFAAQQAFGVPYASDEVRDRYVDILSSQRSFDEGPGGESPYGGNIIERMVGNCSLMEGEKRAPKASFSFEYFTLLQNINHMTLDCAGESRPLLAGERQTVMNLAFSVKELKYARIRKELQLSPETTFKSLRYGGKTLEEVEKGAKFTYLTAYHKIKSVFDKVNKTAFPALSTEKRDQIALVLTLHKDETKVKDKLLEVDIQQEYVDALLNAGIGFSKFGHISVAACNRLIPQMEKGLLYNQACAEAGLNFQGYHRGEKAKYLHFNEIPELDDINNPVVRRGISQTIKVVNAIIREQGRSPSFISVELAREMGKTKRERDDMQNQFELNNKANERIKDRLETEFGIANPTGQDIVKLKLWQEQDGICPYSQKPLQIEYLFAPGYAEVDHVIPYSISFNDGYKNKVLVHSEENRQKGNRLPLEYLTGVRGEKFEVWVRNGIRNIAKRQNLLKQKLTEDDEKQMKERNLTDTKYISRTMHTVFSNYLEFTPSETGKKQQVMAVNGSVTAYLRKRWSISKIRANGDLHHAVDAVVIACVTPGLVQRITRYSKNKEIVYSEQPNESLVIHKKTGELLHRLPYPWPDFRKELDAWMFENPGAMLQQLNLPAYQGINVEDIKGVFVSRMPRRKATGAAHKETIFSPKELSEGLVIKSVPLQKLTLDKDTGEIVGYYEQARQSDRRLYEALREQLRRHDGKGEPAFVEPFYKPTKSGAPGNLVKTVKLQEKSNLHVMLNEGNAVAANNSMVRIDVFYVENQGYYWVPIYVSDTKKKQLPNKAVVHSKKYEDWIEMKQEDFVFSLYPNDLLWVEHKKSLKFSLFQKESSLPKELVLTSAYIYFVCAGISVASITVKTHDSAYTIPSLGLKTLKNLRKCNVDTLGNITFVKKEKRSNFQ